MYCQRCGGDGKIVREIWGFNRINEYVVTCPQCDGEGKEMCHACGDTDVFEEWKIPDKKNNGYFHYFCSEECFKEYAP